MKSTTQYVPSRSISCAILSFQAVSITNKLALLFCINYFSLAGEIWFWGDENEIKQKRVRNYYLNFLYVLMQYDVEISMK